MSTNNMQHQFLARAAQSAFNRAGYDKSEAFHKAQQVADYVEKNLDECRRRFNSEDELELAYRVAQARLNGVLASGVFNLSDLLAR
jgi:hypothetical protein